MGAGRIGMRFRLTGRQVEISERVAKSNMRLQAHHESSAWAFGLWSNIVLGKADPPSAPNRGLPQYSTVSKGSQNGCPTGSFAGRLSLCINGAFGFS